MSDDYLWDGSGEPDPEIQKLESVLRRFRQHRPAPFFPEIVDSASGKARFSLRLLFQPRWFAAAGLAILGIGLASFVLLRLKAPALAPSDWRVTNVQGVPRLAGTAMQSPATKNLGFGQVLETDSASTAKIRDEETGEIQIDPGTRLLVLASRQRVQRLQLERGAIRVTIWADPGRFVVDTPSATAVDLGCVYSLKVDDSGDGILRTEMGWVGFKLQDREAFIPAGAACSTRKKAGPGTPYFEDASPEFREALARFDDPDAGGAERDTALSIVIARARPRDALTLWHLLSRVTVGDRARVDDRLAQLARPPAGVTREGILRLDPQMLDLWWDSLGFGDTSLWRHWERSWSPGAAQEK